MDLTEETMGAVCGVIPDAVRIHWELAGVVWELRRVSFEHITMHAKTN